MKKITILLVTVLLLVQFAGCSKVEDTNATVTTKGSADATAAPPTEERYTFVFATALNNAPDKDSPMELYWEERLGSDFEIIFYETASYRELLNLDIAAGKIPDVFTSHGSANMRKYYDEGILGGFTQEFLAESAPSLFSYYTNIGDDAFNMATIDGLMYTLPAYNPDLDYPPSVVWNIDWLNAVGVSEPPTDLNDFVEALYLFRNNDPDGNDQKDTYGFSASSMDMIYGAFGVATGMWIEQSDGTLAYDIAQEGSVEALTLLAKLYADEVLDPEYITGENKGGYWAISNAFAEGRIGLSSLGAWYHWITPEGLDRGITCNGTPLLIQTTNPDMKYDLGNAPVGPGGKSGTKYSQALSAHNLFSKALVSDTKRFKKLLSNAEITGGFIDPYDYVVSMMGIEDTHWSYVNGQPTRFPEYVASEAMCAIGSNGMLNVIYSADGYRTLFNNRFDWIDEMYTDLTKAGYKNVVTDTLPSQADYFEECSKVLTEAKNAIITGEKPITYYDEAIKQFKALGGDILTKEANELYAR